MVRRQVLFLCVFGIPPLLAADDVTCFQSENVSVSHDQSGFSVTLRNHCDRDVTAYRLDATVHFANGRTLVLKGMKQDFLPSLMFRNMTVGRGAIRPGEVRESPVWPISFEEQPPPLISGVRPKISAVVFRDKTAVGIEADIAALFESRRFQLQELRFWQQSFRAAKGNGQSPVSLLQIGSRIDLPPRKYFAKDPQEKVEIEAIGGGLKRMLASLVAQTGEGKTTAQEAVQRFERYLDDRTAATEEHALRAK